MERAYISSSAKSRSIRGIPPHIVSFAPESFNTRTQGAVCKPRPGNIARLQVLVVVFSVFGEGLRLYPDGAPQIDSSGGDRKAGRGRNLRFAYRTAARTMRENPHMPHDADLAATFAAILFQTSQDALDRIWTRSSSFGVAQRNPQL
jgi:hypothetical protein